MTTQAEDSSTSIADKVFVAGHTAVITGASSGIGRAAAAYCAGKGMNVFLADIDETDLEEAVKFAESKSKSSSESEAIIKGIHTDVASESSVQALAKVVLDDNQDKIKTVHFLMNNAGVGKGGGPMTDPKIMDQVMKINTMGPIHGCQAFLPRMKEVGDIGLVVQTGSKQGITMPPGNLVYNMSKAALKCYAEGLEHELRTERKESKHKISSALLVPGWVNTSIVLKTMDTRDPKECFFHENKPADGAWMPSQVIDFLVEELNKGRFYIICPDNDVDRETDNLRMQWTMQDITENRPPLSRWHEDYTPKFDEFVKASKK